MTNHYLESPNYRTISKERCSNHTINHLHSDQGSGLAVAAGRSRVADFLFCHCKAHTFWSLTNALTEMLAISGSMDMAVDIVTEVVDMGVTEEVVTDMVEADTVEGDTVVEEVDMVDGVDTDTVAATGKVAMAEVATVMEVEEDTAMEAGITKERKNKNP